RAPAVRCAWPRRTCSAHADGLARPISPVCALGTRALAGTRCVLCRPGGRGGDRGNYSHHAARDGTSDRSAHRSRRCGRGEGNPWSVDSDGRAQYRSPGQISRCRGGCERRAAGAARLARRPRSATGAGDHAAHRPDSGRAPYSFRQSCRTRRSRCMSVEVTRLPSGLVVVTDVMPHLETAALGVWVGSGSRNEQPDEHGISHLLEHMAFKGTSRRTARQIAEEIEAVGGDLNAATSIETTAYY